MTHYAKLNALSAGGITLVSFCATHAVATWLNRPDVQFLSPTSKHTLYLIAQLSCLLLGMALIFFFIGYLTLSLVNFLGDRLLKKMVFQPSNTYEAIMASFLISLFVVFASIVISRALGISWNLNYTFTLWVALAFGALLSWCGTVIVDHAFLFPPSDYNQRLVVIGSILLIILMISLCFNYLSVNQFSDDEQEAAQFAISLSSHAFPYWDLENGSWGFYQSFMLFAYPMYAITLMFGDGELTFRIFYFISLFICIVGMVALLEFLTSEPIRESEFITLMLGVVLITIIAAFYNSWHPYMAGLAEPSASGMFGFSLFLGSALFLFTGHTRFFLVFSIAGSVALPSGAIYTVTLLGLTAFFQTVDRQRAGILLAAYLVPTSLYYVAYSGIYQAPNHYSVTAFGERYFSQPVDITSAAAFLRLICLISGGTIIPTCIVLLKGSNAYARVLSAFACMHVSAGLIFYNLQHINYYLPVCLLLYVVGIYGLRSFSAGIRTMGVLSVQLVTIGTIWFIFPSKLTIFDNARRLGAVTEVDCSSSNLETLYRDGAEFSKYISWGEHGISLHNWIYYSLMLKPKLSRDVIIADLAAPIPEGYHQLSAGAKCRVIANEAFDPTEYLPCYSYRQERGWGLLMVPKWRDHFLGRSPPIRKMSCGRN